VAFIAPCLLILGLLLAGCGRRSAPGDEIGKTVSAHDELLQQRQMKDAFFRSASSPLLPGEKETFKGLDYYPINPDMRFQVRLQRYAGPKEIRMATNAGDVRSGLLYGFFEFTVEGQTHRLQVYRLEEAVDKPALFIPFRDATSGVETYEGGRFIDLIENTSGIYDLDFNRAYNPYCAFNPEYSCPVPPKENTLAAPVRAGEKKYRQPPKISL